MMFTRCDHCGVETKTTHELALTAVGTTIVQAFMPMFRDSWPMTADICPACAKILCEQLKKPYPTKEEKK